MVTGYKCIRCGGVITKDNGTYVCTNCGLWCYEDEGAGAIGIKDNKKPNNSYESIIEQMYGNKGGQNEKY